MLHIGIALVLLGFIAGAASVLAVGFALMAREAKYEDGYVIVNEE